MIGFELPDSWLKTNIGEICEKVTDGSHNPPKASTDGLPMLSAKNILGGRINFELSHRLIDLESFELEDKRTKIAPNDILLTTVGTLGRVAVVSESTPRFTLQRSVSVLSALNIHPQYLRYSIEEPYFQKQIVDNARGTAQKGIYLKKLKELEVSLPPLAEQKVIAEKLDTLLVQVDSIKSRLDAIPDILKRFRQSVLAAAVSGKLTEEWREGNSPINAIELLDSFNKVREKRLQNELDNGNKEIKRLLGKISKHNPKLPEDKVPANWTWTTLLGSMEKVVDCHNKTAPYIEKGIPLIRTPDIRNGRISLSGAKYISRETYEYWSKRCPPESGDIIFTREAPMGEAGIVPENTKLCMGQRMMLLRPVPEFINPKYLMLNILSLQFQERMTEQAVGTAVKHLRVADVESLSYPLAPKEEQDEIVRKVDKLFRRIETIENKVSGAQDRVNNLTQSILAKAFRGELTADWRDQNPDLISGENSAEALLEAIRAEKEKLKPVKKAKKKKAG